MLCCPCNGVVLDMRSVGHLFHNVALTHTEFKKKFKKRVDTWKSDFKITAFITAFCS